jgi:lysozyme
MTYATSNAGLALIQQYEGFRAEPTQLPDGNWVVGYSHVRVGGSGEVVSRAEAAEVLALDLAPFERLVNALVTRDLNQAQFDALVSFAFSLGAEAFQQSQVLRRVNAGDFVAAACAMDAWRKSDIGGEVVIVDALVRRRAAEKALFLRDLDHDAAPSVFMRAKLDYAASVLGAPVKYASAPDLKLVSSQPQPQPEVKREPAQVITDILKSEPQTELLLTQIVVANDLEDETEIVTAHAKPVARPLDNVREATRRAYAEQTAKDTKSRFSWFKQEPKPYRTTKLEMAPDRRIRAMRQRAKGGLQLPSFNFSGSFENVGLIALLVFGLALMALGGSLLFNGNGDFVEIAGAAALVTPGLAATLMAAVGLWRGPRESAVY